MGGMRSGGVRAGGVPAGGRRAGVRHEARFGHAGRSLIGLLCLAMFASGCSLWPFDAPAAEAAEGMRWLTDDECAGLSLGRADAVPLDPVAIEGWPVPDGGDHGVVVARILDAAAPEADEDDAPVLIVPDWHVPVALPTPVHPSGDLGGGVVHVRIGQRDDGDERWCGQTHTLRIRSLPAAEAEEGIAAQLAEVDRVLDRLLEPHGTTGTTLAATDRAAVVPDLLPLHIVAVLLHHDAGLTASVADLTADERDLADRLLAQVQQRAADAAPVGDVEVELRPAVADTTASPPASRTATRTARRSSRGGHVDARRLTPEATPGLQPVAGGGACTATDLAGLADLMGKQFSGATMSGGETAFAIEAALVVGGLPVIGRVGFPTVLTAWVTKFVAQYLDTMLPSNWEHAAIDHAPTELWEDDVLGGDVDGITMRFSSDGWDAGPVLAELAIILAGSLVSSALTRHLKKPRRGDPGVIEFWGELVYESLEAHDAASAEAELVAEVVAYIVGEVMSDVAKVTGIAADNLVFAPHCWEAATRRPDLDDTLRLHYLGAIERGTTDEHYVAASIGTGRIDARWELPVGASILGFNLSRGVRDARFTFGANAHVEVRPLTITWDPPNQQVRPGDLVTLNVLVAGAHDGRIRITDSLGRVDRVMDASDGGVLLYQVPDDWDEAAPIAVTAVSLADQGLRDPRHPGYRGPIDATALLRADRVDLYLDPAVSCVDPEETIRLRVVDDPLTGGDVEVVWETDGGRLDGNGRFTAPSQPGEVTVTATAVHDAELTASWTLAVGGCDRCSWELTIDGLLGPEERLVTSGEGRLDEGLFLTGVDWTSGSFQGLGTGIVGGGGGVILQDPSGEASRAPTRSMDVVDAPFDVVSRFDDDFVPTERSDPYRHVYAQSSGVVPLVGWDPPAVAGRLDVEVVTAPEFRSPRIAVPERPMLTVSGEVTGSIVVGRHITSFVGSSPADAAEWVGEPIFGTFTLRVEATLHPHFDDRLNPQHVIPRPGEERSLEGQLEQPLSLREYDLDNDLAWCGGPHADAHEAPFNDNAEPGGDADLPALPELPPRP